MSEIGIVIPEKELGKRSLVKIINAEGACVLGLVEKVTIDDDYAASVFRSLVAVGLPLDSVPLLNGGRVRVETAIADSFAYEPTIELGPG